MSRITTAEDRAVSSVSRSDGNAPSSPWRVYAVVLIASVVIGSMTLFATDTLYSVPKPPQWDGALYLNVSRDAVSILEQRLLGQYYVQRIIPSLSIYFATRVLHTQPTTESALFGFKLLNCVLIVGIAIFWCLIAARLRFTVGRTLLGAAALLVNFAVLKHRTYDPALTDTTAFFLGIVMLYCYLSARIIPLVLTILLGAFTWPTILFQGLILVVFPPVKSDDPLKVSRYPHVLALSIGCITALVYLVLASDLVGSGFRIRIGYAYAPALYLSLALGAAYMLLGVAYIVPAGLLLFPRRVAHLFWSRRAMLRIGLAAALYYGIRAIQHRFAAPGVNEYPIAKYFSVSVYTSIMYPLAHLVAHIMYFGPILFLTLFYWKRVAAESKKFLGLAMCLLFCLCNSLNAESRGIINFYPMLVLLTVLAIDQGHLSRKYLWTFFLCSAVLSKVWLTIGPMNLNGSNVLLDNQLLFMNNGPAMSGAMYVVQGTVVLLLGIAFYYHQRLSARSETPVGT